MFLCTWFFFVFYFIFCLMVFFSFPLGMFSFHCSSFCTVSFFFRMLLIPFPLFASFGLLSLSPLIKLFCFPHKYRHTHTLASCAARQHPENALCHAYALLLGGKGFCFSLRQLREFFILGCTHTHTQFDRRKRTLPTFAHSVAHYTSSRFKSIWVANLSLVTIFYTARLCVPRKYTRPWLAAGLGAPWAGLVSLLCFIQ